MPAISSAFQPGDVPLSGRRSGGRAFVVCGAAFIVVAAVIAVINTSAPVAHGWWLVAYLGLVGGVAQIMLGPGLAALARRGDSAAPALRHEVAEMALWNAGTVTVAVADLAAAPGGVLAGSVLLTVALALFAGELRGAMESARRPVTGWSRVYALLLGFLAVSVVVGTVLAFRRAA